MTATVSLLAVVAQRDDGDFDVLLSCTNSGKINSVKIVLDFFEDYMNSKEQSKCRMHIVELQNVGSVLTAEIFAQCEPIKTMKSCCKARKSGSWAI